MSYTVLARRYRSSTFDEVVGQNHVAQTLKRAIESGRIAHAYLFCGTRGTGKTSMARIMAKALNCEKAKKPTTEPCNECSSCVGINRGDDIDVIEIDAASNTQVEKTREIIDNAQYRPARARFKVYIIDEAHMLSKASFNALLKTLEEPPEHVKFILATTEPEKILPTILSRCQRFDFRSIPTREIAEHLKNICKKEKIKADEDALLLIAKTGAGSMRDSLSLLDRLLSIGEKQLTMETVEQLLGMPKAQLLFDLAQRIGEGNVKVVLEQTDKILAGGLSPDTLVASLVDHLRTLLILRTCGPDSTLVEVPGLSIKELSEQAQRFDATVLTQDITILEELRRLLRQTQAGRALLDATFVRLALADQFSAISDLLERVNGNGPTSTRAAAAPAQKKKPEPLETSPATSPPSIPEPAAESQAATDDESDDDLPRPGKVWEAPKGPSLAEMMRQQSASAPPPKPAPAPAPQPAPIASNIEPVNADDLPAVWQKLLELVASRGAALHALLAPGQLSAINDGHAIVRYAPKDGTFVRMLDRNGKKDLVRDTLTQLLDRPVGVKFEIDPSLEAASETATATLNAPAPTRAPSPQTVRREIPQPASAPVPEAPRLTPELKEQLRNDPWVKAVLEEFGGDIVKVE